MISHVIYISYIALLSTHAALQLDQTQSPCSRAAEIFPSRWFVSTRTPEIPFYSIKQKENQNQSDNYLFSINVRAELNPFLVPTEYCPSKKIKTTCVILILLLEHPVVIKWVHFSSYICTAELVTWFLSCVASTARRIISSNIFTTVGTQHEKCRRILKHVLIPYDCRSYSEKWRVVYDHCLTRAACATKVAYNSRKQKSYTNNCSALRSDLISS